LVKSRENTAVFSEDDAEPTEAYVIEDVDPPPLKLIDPPTERLNATKPVEDAATEEVNEKEFLDRPVKTETFL